ncbi:MAG TPA: efflux RND transporter periplasmic adaptor subunit [Vicinamibacterales bacterium]|nr:efflux RND transporter periplasmic adaptor subunit [Vicinamibacterales bacterium]
MKKLLPVVIILAVLGAGGAVFYANRPEKEPTVTTLQVSRGDIVDGVGATGTLQAVTTVTVGTQVSGIVQELYADFNSIVKKGQVVARLDPSILQTQVETAKANLNNAMANLERQKVTLDDARQKLARARELSARQLATKVDLENAELNVKTAEAQLKSTESSIVQAKAAVNKAEVDLDHTVITAPIDGIVIKRSVDRGQTVAASMSAPELFIIAADLTAMQVNASIDESDVGRMRPGQAVSFRVDAYPNETFHGSVKQVRLNPVTVQNVVTYSTVIDVPNPELKLKPGMTAQVTIEIARRQNVLRVPNAALRFRPTTDIFAAFNQPVPPELERGFGRGRRGDTAGGPGGAPTAGGARGGTQGTQGTGGTAPGTAAPGQAPQNQQRAQNAPTGGTGQRQRPEGQQAAPADGQRARGEGQAAQGGAPGPGGGRGGGFANMTPEEREKRWQERLAQMSPEERAQAEERRRQREAQGGQGGGRGGFGPPQGGGPGEGFGGARSGSQTAQGPGGQGQGAGQGRRGDANAPRGQVQGQQAANSRSAAVTSATTIDALFGPLATVETRGRAWLFINKQLKPVDLRLGISDGTFTEVINADALQPGQEVVTAVVTPEMASRPANQQNNANNPLMPQRGRGPGGPGGGGGGRGGGRG